jgi:uncharacterized Zn finger protein
MRESQRECQARPGTLHDDTNLPDCPLCSTRLIIQQIIPGRYGVEHWTLQCTNCGHIHQDAVDGASDAIRLRA